MLQSHQVEELICLVAALDRPSLIRQFRSYQAPFPVDFTPEFLETVPLERLRHIFVALCLQSQHMPAPAADRGWSIEDEGSKVLTSPRAS